MLTKAMLEAMPPDTIFATGVSVDEPEGLFLARTGKRLRWVAVRGKGIPDWTIYAHFEHYDIHWVRDHGDKVHMEENIRRVVPCDDEAFRMYRY